MEFDVVIVGAGPAGLSAACRLKQKAAEAGSEISVCVVEKGSEVGAHILSGAVFEPRALNELFPDWKALGAPLNTEVKRDDIYVLKDAGSSTKVPDLFVPKTMHNQGNYIISLGNLCRWLAQQAENLAWKSTRFAAQKHCSTTTAWSAASSPVTSVSTVKATRRTACTPRAWNCAPSTPCSPKAAVAISASN